MRLICSLILNIYSVVLLLVMLFNCLKNVDNSYKFRIFTAMLYIAIFLLIAGIFSFFEEGKNIIYSILNVTANYIVFSSILVLPSLWLLYVYSNIFKNKKLPQYIIYLLCFLNFANIVLVTVSQYSGWIYRINADNILVEGKLYLLPICSAAVIMSVSLFLIIFNIDKIKNGLITLLFSSFFPLLGTLLQYFLGGYPFMVNSEVVALFAAFVNLQRANIYIDYLTDINNRKSLDLFLREKIRKSSGKSGFTAIMLDINNFKQINDVYGHNEGDNALRICAEILKGSIRWNDFLARYGGDEFFIVLDMANETETEVVIQRIKSKLNEKNRARRSYNLELSMGYAVYCPDNPETPENFLKKVDKLLYKNKHIKSKKLNN